MTERDEILEPRMPIAEPSRFWKRLGHDHADDLARYGLGAIKRHQALRYFTWRWTWGSLGGSRQMRFLLGHTSPATLVRCLLTPAALSGPAWAGLTWPRRDRWLYVFAVRLLWEYARRRDALDVLSLPEPELGGPLPVAWRGRLISQDLANTSLEATAMWGALGGARPRSVLEIGAGYGRTAYALLSLFPSLEYTIVDIEPALTISRAYLTHLFPSRRISFLRPEVAAVLSPRTADLAISISSLQEMTFEQVAFYLDVFDRVAGGGCVYLKQWRRWTNPEDGITLDFDEYPIPPRWRRLFGAPAPVQTYFQQAAWRVP